MNCRKVFPPFTKYIIKYFLHYVSDSLPDVGYFGIDQMNEERKTKFLKWHECESERLRSCGEKYDFRREMKKYCYDDCYVLATAFGRFNESMINELIESNVKDIVCHQYTILADFITLPQLVIHWYVGASMPPRTLAIVPHSGYDNGKCGSLKENIWLSYLDKLHEEIEGVNFVPIRFRYCSGQKQKVIGRYHLDGFRILTNGSRECYEFYGCYYHGCLTCFPDRSKVIRHKYRENGYHIIEKAYRDTISCEIEIKNLLKFEEGFDKWISVWEHDYNDNEKLYRDYLMKDNMYELVDKLNPRDSVKGDRTEVFRMYCCVEDPENERISYLDINSLYPYVMSKIDFPLGHPEIRRGNHSCRNLLSKLRSTNVDFIGVCQVRVLPPDNLFVPCLAHKMDGKLSFCLCRTCASNGQMQRIRCSHNEGERSWIDVYTSIDIARALLIGYKILEYKKNLALSWSR